MLGMMCAAAAENGTILAFVGRGYGSDWPDPREPRQIDGDLTAQTRK
jgi:hypothetical protein